MCRLPAIVYKMMYNIIHNDFVATLCSLCCAIYNNIMCDAFLNIYVRWTTTGVGVRQPIRWDSLLVNIIQRAGPGENQYFLSRGREITSSAPKKNRNSSVLVTCLPHCIRRLIKYNNMVYRWLRRIGSETHPVLNLVKSLYDLLKSSKYYYNFSQMDRLYSKIIVTPRVRADMWYTLFFAFRLARGRYYSPF